MAGDWPLRLLLALRWRRETLKKRVNGKQGRGEADSNAQRLDVFVRRGGPSVRVHAYSRIYLRDIWIRRKALACLSAYMAFATAQTRFQAGGLQCYYQQVILFHFQNVPFPFKCKVSNFLQIFVAKPLLIFRYLARAYLDRTSFFSVLFCFPIDFFVCFLKMNVSYRLDFSRFQSFWITLRASLVSAEWSHKIHAASRVTRWEVQCHLPTVQALVATYDYRRRSWPPGASVKRSWNAVVRRILWTSLDSSINTKCYVSIYFRNPHFYFFFLFVYFCLALFGCFQRGWCKKNISTWSKVFKCGGYYHRYFQPAIFHESKQCGSLQLLALQLLFILIWVV